jgi:hypothetical protein
MENAIRGIDLARGFEKVRSVDILPVIREVGNWRPFWTVAEFEDRDNRVFRRSHFRPTTLKDLESRFQDRLTMKLEFGGNCLLNEGIDEAWLLICGLGSPTAFNNANARIGVGDSATAAAATQTGLQASTNKYWMTMDTSYPTSGTQKATWKATFATGVANFSWQEITVVNASDDAGKNLNRKVQDMGTKTSAVTRVATLDITLA